MRVRTGGPPSVSTVKIWIGSEESEVHRSIHNLPFQPIGKKPEHGVQLTRQGKQLLHLSIHSTVLPLQPSCPGYSSECTLLVNGVNKINEMNISSFFMCWVRLHARAVAEWFITTNNS